MNSGLSVFTHKNMILKNTDQHDFYLVIHNIDGAMLRSEKTQNILSLLAQVRGIHLIASVDHINAPLSKQNTYMSVVNVYMHYVLPGYILMFDCHH